MANSIIILAWLLIIALALTIITALWSNSKGAPWLPTSRKKIFRMLELANVQQGETVYDLGCGDGRVLIIAATRYGAKAVGIEIDPIRFLWCQFIITILGLRKKVKVIFGDIFKQNLEKADVVFCYLLQSTNDKLEDKLIRELPSDTRIVSNTFMFHSLPLLAMDTYAALYLYMIGIESIDDLTIEEKI